MKYLSTLLPIFLIGCATVTQPENECRLTVIDGEGRYGTITQYVKGEAVIVRQVTQGEYVCPNVSIKIEGKRLKLTVETVEAKSDEEIHNPGD